MEKKDYNKLINFVEEISWILDTYKNLEFKNVIQELRMDISSRNNIIHNFPNDRNKDERTNLIGILPVLLNDKQLFNKNSDLVNFAESTFKIKISRRDKRSRYELIGMIVMELLEVNEQKFKKTFHSINKITSNQFLLEELKEKKKKTNFSWNKAIQDITK